MRKRIENNFLGNQRLTLGWYWFRILIRNVPILCTKWKSPIWRVFVNISYFALKLRFELPQIWLLRQPHVSFFVLSFDANSTLQNVRAAYSKHRDKIRPAAKLRFALINLICYLLVELCSCAALIVTNVFLDIKQLSILNAILSHFRNSYTYIYSN